ncbi:MAG: DUF4105 domain-containing protein [Rhodothermaceae bacterium]|nr:DUF4105 domain-containing protein [Rhodothermaceae bacterium]
MHRFVFLAFLGALVIGALPLRAQPAAALSDSAQVSLLTMLPGEEVYSLFGHSAFRIADPALGLDRTYNFGTFDFAQPFFILRFARGQLDYLLDTAPMAYEVDKYAFLERPMIEQRLALPPEAARALYAMLETNALPENRAYRYDFFFDNCSTRLLVALDSALVAAGQPRLSLPTDEPPGTFRTLIAPYIVGDPLLALGINLGLGLPTDREATPREATFLPVELMQQLDGATVGGQRLVVQTDTLVAVPGYEPAERALPWPLLLTWGLLALGLAMTVWGRLQKRTGSKAGRRADGLLFAVIGLAGLLLAFLWFGTEHRVTGPNLNLLWAWPPHLVAARWLHKNTLPQGLRGYLGVAGLAALATALGWVLFPQALPAAALPLVLLVALRALARAFPPPSTA